MKRFLPIFALSASILLTGCLDSGIEEYDDTADLLFYEEFLQEDGVIMTDSGLLYRVVEEGEGNPPQADNFVFVFYEGNSVDESLNYRTGETQDIFLPSEMGSFTGLGEGVQLMRPGAVFEFVLPTNLAIQDGRVFYFELELESFLMTPENFLAANAQEEDISVTESGLQYRVIEEGDEEGASPGASDTVIVEYTGMYTNGYVFDESGEDPSEFSLSGVISGFSEGLQLMKEGAKFELYLPASIGYGSNPPQGILPGAVLVFEVELIDVLN
jgi:FKBP-type peptidyl-prolyl cis-trans isomerase